MDREGWNRRDDVWAGWAKRLEMAWVEGSQMDRGLVYRMCLKACNAGLVLAAERV